MSKNILVISIHTALSKAYDIGKAVWPERSL